MTRRSSPARDAAIAWHVGQHRAICDVQRSWDHGELVRATARPSYWDYNKVYATGPLADWSAEDLARVADEHHGDLAHRQVQVEDEEAGLRLRPGFEAMGWKATPLVFMAHGGDIPPVPDGLELREAPDAAAEPLRRVWYPEDEWARDPEILDAFIREERGVHEVLGGHVLVVEGDGPDGLVAYVRIRIAGNTGEIAEAYAIPAVRGRGIGTALVLAGAH